MCVTGTLVFRSISSLSKLLLPLRGFIYEHIICISYTASSYQPCLGFSCYENACFVAVFINPCYESHFESTLFCLMVIKREIFMRGWYFPMQILPLITIKQNVFVIKWISQIGSSLWLFPPLPQVFPRLFHTRQTAIRKRSGPIPFLKVGVCSLKKCWCMK